MLGGRVTLVLLVAIATFVSAQTVTFPDPGLEAAVRDALNKPSGGITTADMLTLTNLPAAWRGITDTRGLETALNLLTLELTGNPVTNYAGFSGLANLNRLDFSSAGLSDLTFLSGLNRLQTLFIGGNQIQDISPLGGLRGLQTVHLDWNTVTNLSVLSGLTNLVSVGVAGNGVTNLDFLAPLRQLQSLGLYLNSVQDISPLAGLTNLLTLDLGWNAVTNPAALATLTGLQDLALSGSVITNFLFLCGLTNLTSLDLVYTTLADLSPVTNLTKLNSLNVGENSLTSLPNLSGFTNLTTFMLAGNQITDLSPLANLPVVDQLHLQRNLFQDMSPLARLPGLQVLLLSGNTITNLSTLQVLTNLGTLEMQSMHLGDLDFLPPLPQLWQLDLGGNQVTRLTVLTNLPSLGWLHLDQDSLQDIGPLLDCQSLGYVNLRFNLLDTNATSAAWNVITNLQVRGVRVEFDPQYPPSVLPSIVVQPRNLSAFTDTDASFSVTATTTAPALSYRWQKNGVDLTDSGTISGTDTDTLHLNAVAAADAGLYRVRVWTDFGTSNSVAAELRVITSVVLADPNLEQAVRDALGDPPGPLTPEAVAGITWLDASYYDIADLSGIEALVNLVGLTLSGNQTISGFQSLTYLPALNALAVNDCGLDNLDWLAGLTTLSEVQFGENFVEDLSPLRALGSLVNVYAAENQLTVITPLLDLSALEEVDISRNRLTTNASSVAWAVITNLVDRGVSVEFDPQYAAPLRPEIISQPVNVLARLGDTINFHVGVSGHGFGLNYQWQKNGVNLPNDPHITGADADTLELSSVGAGDAGSYRVRVWDNLGVTNSRIARLRVITSVSFVDPNLEQAVRDQLGIPSAPLTFGDIQGLTWLIARGRGITNLAGLEAAVNLNYLLLNDNPGLRDFTLLAEMPSLRQVFLDGCVVGDLSFATMLPLVWELTARGGQISDLSPLADCSKLEILDLGGNPALTNLAVLNGLTNLDSLALDSTSISNISFMKVMPGLRYLNIWGNAVHDLSPLTNCFYLDQLEGGNNQITDAALLASCTNLGGLGLADNQLNNVGFIAGLWKLSFLNVESNPIHDLSPLAGLTNLYWLATGWTGVTNLAPIADLTKLDTLYVWNLGVSNLSYLAALTNLTLFSAGQNGITNLPPYPHLSKLVQLSLEGNPLANINFVAGMTNLQEAFFGRCGITDLTPLTGRTNLLRLHLEQNRISAIAPLAGLPYLASINLYDNNLQNITLLSGLTNLQDLDLRLNLLDINTGSPAMSVIETLQGRGTSVNYDPQKTAPTAIELSAPTWLGVDQFQFSITSDPGSTFEVLISTDLANWAHLGYVTNNAGTVSFTDSTATGARKFYRLRLQ